MNCTKCGKALPEEARFCPWCGLKDPATQRTRNPKRRGNGTGSVWRKASTGRWTAQVTIGTYNGKRRYRTKSGFRTKKEALDYLPTLQSGRSAQARDMRVSAIWEAMSPRWLDSLSPGKAGHYEKAYQRLSPLWGAQIGNLIAQDWQEIIDKIPGKYDPKKDARIVVSKLYQYAMAQGWVTVNMAEHILLPGQNKTRKDAFTRQELDALWRSWQSGHSWTAYIIIMCYTGMRPGELRTVRLEHVHLEDGYLVGGIKTEAGRNRCISFPAFLKPVLQWAVEHGKNGKLLAINEQRFYEEYDNALMQAGIRRTPERPMTPHCCRHTFVTMGTDSGIPLAVLQKMAGHSDVSVTAGYNHTHDPELIQAAQRLYCPDFLDGRILPDD